MGQIKISQLIPKGLPLSATDLMVIAEVIPGGYESKSITGTEILTTARAGLQAELVSGTNIKTINGNSLLGTGDIVVGGSLTIGTTAISSGTVGRILFEGTGNVLQQSANIFWDNTNGRLGIGTSTPSAIIHSVGSVTASSGVARGNYLNNTLVASANSNVLVALDIQPTFTNGAFTGVDNFSLRINAGKGVIGTTANAGIFPFLVRQFNYSGLLIQNSSTGSNHNSAYDGFGIWLNYDVTHAKALITNFENNGIAIYNGSNANSGFNIFGTNNNIGINTTTDAGFKLDVNGTARVQGAFTSTGAATVGGYINFGSNVLAGISSLLVSGGGSSSLALRANGSIEIAPAASTKIATFTSTGVKIGDWSTPVASAIFEITSTTKGFLPPRMTTSQKTAIASPTAGLVVFDTTLNKLCVYTTTWETITSL
jgi:hypothetical protein